MIRRAPALLILAAVTLAAPRAEAADFQIRSETLGDFYAHLRSDRTEIERRRLHQLLGLSIFDITGDGSNQVFFVSSFRFDSDLGIARDELDRIAQLEREKLTILFAYIEARDLFGFLDVKAGRQLEVDAVDMLLYDGLKVRASTPWYFGVEALVGLEARNDFGPITQTSHEVDGRLEGDLMFDGTVAEVSPGLVYGASLFLRDVPTTNLDVAFREIRHTDDGNIEQRRVALSFQQALWGFLFIGAEASYDLFLDLPDEVRGELRFRPTDWFDGRLAYHYLIPSFSADSIFNVFSWQPINQAEATATFWLDPALSVYAGGYVSFLQTDGSAAGVTDELVEDIGVTAGGRWTVGARGSVFLDVDSQVGYGGTQTFVDAGTDWTFLGRTFGIDGRLLLILFDDELQANLDGTMLGAQAGGFWQFTGGGRLRLLVEEVTTELQPSWFRVMGSVDLNYWL